jgi:hypothetical protein
MKILVTSANTSGIFSNTCVKQKGYDVDFICYNKNNFSIRQNGLHPRTVGKIPKMLSWELKENYDYYIWFDYSFNINREDTVEWFINQLGNADVAFFKHPHRNTVIDELNFCIDNMKIGNQYLLQRYDGERMVEQVDKYIKDGFVDNILIAAGSFIYSNNLVKNREYNLMKEWFYHNCLYSVQDQLSLPYLLQKLNINFNIIEENILECKYLK